MSFSDEVSVVSAPYDKHPKSCRCDVRHELHPPLRRMILRCLAVGLLVSLLVVCGWMLGENLSEVEAWIKGSGGLAPVLYIVIFVVAASIFIPVDVLVFAAGVLFGFGYGVLWVSCAALVAALIQFGVARYWLRGRAENFLRRHPSFETIDRALSRQATRVAFLLRLGPVPFAPLSYLLGISRINFRDYMFTLPAGLPSFLAVVYYGDVAAHLTKLATGQEHGSALHYVVMVFGLVMAVITTVYVTHVARKALREAGALVEGEGTPPVANP